MSLPILIVEDELILAYTMEEMLKAMGYKNCLIEPEFEKARGLITRGHIKLALLDINLGNGEEGLTLAEEAGKAGIPFIYISSYTDKATLDKALKTNPAAYLIKPVSEGNLYTTLQIVLDRERIQSVPVLEFKDGTQLIRLSLDKVLYLKSENIYVNVVTAEKTFLYRGSLKSLIDKVPERKLIQTHRAYAVNPAHVMRVAATYVVIGDQEIPISRNYKNRLNAE